MNTNNKKQYEEHQNNHRYDHGDTGRPRDFDIRIEATKQQEIIRQSQAQLSRHRWDCSEYDF